MRKRKIYRFGEASIKERARERDLARTKTFHHHLYNLSIFMQINQSFCLTPSRKENSKKKVDDFIPLAQVFRVPKFTHSLTQTPKINSIIDNLHFDLVFLVQGPFILF